VDKLVPLGILTTKPPASISGGSSHMVLNILKRGEDMIKYDIELKVKILIILILFFCINITGCNNVDLENNNFKYHISKYNIIDISEEFSLEKKENYIKKLKVEEVVLPVPEKGKLGDQAFYEDVFYYVVNYTNNYSNYANKAEIYSYNIQTKKLDALYSYNNISDQIYVNELRVNSKCLFWQVSTPDSNWKFNEFNLKDKNLKIIRSKEDEKSKIPMIVSLSDKYLSWFELTEVDEKEFCSLKIYNISEKTITTLSNEVFMTSPFDRATIKKEVVTFLNKEKDNTNINVYNLQNNKNLQLTLSDVNILNPISNQKYTVWHDNYGDANVYLHDHFENETYKILSKGDGKVFSIELLNDFVIINERKSNNILCLDMNNRKKINLTENLNKNSRYVLTMTTLDDKIISRNGNKSLVISICKCQ
jgi:hypothetical protein